MNLSLKRPELLRNCLVDGVVGNVWIKKIEDGDFLFLFGTINVEYMAGPPVRAII